MFCETLLNDLTKVCDDKHKDRLLRNNYKQLTPACSEVTVRHILKYCANANKNMLVHIIMEFQM